MKSVRTVMTMDTTTASHDSLMQFNLDPVGRSLSRLPPTWVARDWLPEVGGFTVQELGAMHKTLAKTPFRIMCRVCYIDVDSVLTTRGKIEWKRDFTARAKAFSLTEKPLDCIRFNRSFTIDWHAGGHYSFLPVVTDDVEPAEHIFQEIAFRGVSVSISSDFTVRASWSLEDNWAYLKAYIMNPQRPEVKLFCFKFFQSTTSEGFIHDQAQDRPSIVAALGDAPLLQIANTTNQTSEKVDDEKHDGAESVTSVLARGTSSSSLATPQNSAPQPSPNKVVKVVSFPGVRRAPPSEPGRKSRAAKIQQSLALE